MFLKVYNEWSDISRSWVTMSITLHFAKGKKILFYLERFIKIKVEAFKTIKVIIGGDSLILFVGQKINVLFTFIREVARSHPSSGRRRIGTRVRYTTTLYYFDAHLL